MPVIMGAVIYHLQEGVMPITVESHTQTADAGNTALRLFVVLRPGVILGGVG